MPLVVYRKQYLRRSVRDDVPYVGYAVAIGGDEAVVLSDEIRVACAGRSKRVDLSDRRFGVERNV